MSWTVDKVMTSKVLAVRATTGYKELVRLMSERGISALPVVDVLDSEGRLVGIVSEADLLRKEERMGGGRRPRLPRRGTEAKAGALTAAELMTSPVVTVRPDDTLAHAARVMHRRAVKRLPVVDGDGRLVGIVSRADLVKPFLRSDESILHEVRENVLAGGLGLDPQALRVAVEDGVVTLEGELETRLLVDLATRLVRGIEGVVDVKERLACRPDDTAPGTPPPSSRGLAAAEWRR
jgi:CBS domain-containing protein